MQKKKIELTGNDGPKQSYDHLCKFTVVHSNINPVGSSQLRSRSSSPWGAWLFFLALVKMTIGPLILSADMLDFISIISVR